MKNNLLNKYSNYTGIRVKSTHYTTFSLLQRCFMGINGCVYTLYKACFKGNMKEGTGAFVLSCKKEKRYWQIIWQEIEIWEMEYILKSRLRD